MKKRVNFLLMMCLFAVISSFAQENLPWTNGLNSDGDFTSFTVVTSNGNYPKMLETQWGTLWIVHSTSSCIQFQANAGETNLLALPEFSGKNVNELRVKFWYRPYSLTNGGLGTMEVGYMTDVTDATTFTSVKELDNPTSNYGNPTSSSENMWYQAVVDMTSAPVNSRIAIRYTAGTNASAAFYVDDMEVSEQPSCVGISGSLVYSALTHNSVTLSFEDEGTATAWNLYWKKSADDSYTKVSLTQKSYDLTGLDEKTDYEAYVTTDCGESEGDKSNVLKFKTDKDPSQAGITSIPWQEDFENGIEDYTKVITNSGGFPNTVKYAPACYSGEYAYESKQGESLLAFPSLASNIDLSTLRIKFYHKVNISGSNKGELQVGVIDDLNDPSTFTALVSVPANYYSSHNFQTGYKEFQYDFPESVQGAKYIAFKCTSIGSASWYIDDITLEEQPSCLPIDVASVKINNATAESANVVFKDDRNSHSSWNVYYKKTGSTEEYDDVTSMITTDSEGNKVAQLTGLTADTQYEVWVKVNCGNEESEPSDVVTFKTACVAIDFNEEWLADFENGATVDCWNHVTMAQNEEYDYSTYQYVYVDAPPTVHQGAAYSGTAGLRFAAEQGTGYSGLPDFNNIDYTDLRLTFNYRLNDPNGYQYYGAPTLAVGYLTDKSDETTFVELQSIVQMTDWVSAEVILSSVPATANICFKFVGGAYGYAYYDIDNVKLDRVPSCVAISDKNSVALVEGGMQETSLTVTFTDENDTHTAWKVYYKVEGSNDEPQFVSTTSTSSTEISGLSADTRYEIYVTVDCGDEESDASYTKKFKTACGAIAEGDKYQNTFSSSDALDCWTTVESYNYYGTTYPLISDGRLQASGNETSGNLIVSPKIASDINSMRIKFKCQNAQGSYASYYGKGQIIVGVMSDVTNASTFEEIQVIDASPAEWQNITVPLTGTQSVTGTGNYVALKFEFLEGGSYNSEYIISIDDVEISPIPDCAAPQTITVSDITYTSAKLTINDAKETNTQWNLYVEKDGETLEAVSYTTKEINYTLEPGSVYTIWATALCKEGTEESEEESEKVMFAAPAYPVSLANGDWVMNFDEGSKDFNYKTDDPVNNWIVGSATYNGNDGKSLYVSDDGGKSNHYTIGNGYKNYYSYVTLEFGDKGAYEIAFDWKAQGSNYWSNYYGNFYTYVIPADKDVSESENRTNILNMSNVNQTTWTQEVDTIYGVAGQTMHLVFVWGSGDYYYGDGVGAAIDNLSVKGIDCVKPTALTLKSATDTVAEVTWSGNQGTDFRVYYKEENSMFDNSIDITNGETSATLTGLVPGTKYSVYVVNNCDNTQKSNEITFTTLKGVIPITDGELVIDFEETTDADLFSLTKTSAMHWKIGQPLQANTAAATFEKMEGDNTVMFITIDDSTANANSVGTAYATLPIKFGDKTEYEVSFDYRYTQGYYYYHQLRAYLVPSAYSIPITGFPQGIEISLDTSYNWKTRVFAPIQGVAGETYQLVFVWDNTYTGSNVPMPPMIDNVKIKGFDCARPTALDYTNVGEDNITLTWKENAAATSWTLYYGTSDANMQSIDISAANATVNNNVVTYTLNNLVPAAQYQMYVEAQCAQNSAPSATLKVTTLGKRVREFPFLLTFEDPSMYNYAKIVNTGSNLSQFVIGSAAGVDDKYSLASHHSIYTTNDGGQTFAWSNSVSSDTVIVGIQFGDDEEYNIEFDYITSGIENTNGMNVWLQPKKEGAQRIMIVERDFGIGINTWRHVAHKVSGVKGEVYDLVFHWYTGGKDHMNPGGAIDNIFIEGSSCSSVDTVMVDKGHKRYITTLPVSWEDSDPDHTSWTVKYKVSGSAEDDQVVVVDNEKSVLLENLNSGEDYDIHVYANCINGDETTLSVGTYLNINTDCDDYTGGWYDDFAYNKYYNRSTPKCWTRLKSSWGNNWFDQCLYPSIITYAGTGHDPANLEDNGAGDATSMEWKNKGTIATPYFANIENSVFTFWAMANAAGLGLQIYVADDVYDTTTWEPVKYFTTGTGEGQIASTDWDYNKLGQIRIPLNQLISKGTKAVVLDYINGTNTISSLYLDDFRLESDVVFDTPCDNLASDIKAADTETGSVTDGTDRNGQTIKVVPDENMAKIVVTTSGLLKNFDYKLDLTGHPTKHAANGTDTLTFTGLKSGTEHTVWIRTYCAEEKDILDPADGTTVIGKDTVETGTTSDWKEFRFKMAGEDNTYCPQVVEVKVDSIGEGAIKISWTASTEKPAQSFRVMVTTEDDPKADAYDGNYVTVDNTTSTYTFEGLRANTDYYVYVQAICSEGDATWEQNSAKTPKIYVHPTVESISLVAGETVAENNASIVLTGKYKVNDSQVSKMGFQYRERNKTNTLVEVETTEYTSYGGEITFTKTITGLKPSTEYEFKSFIVDANRNDSIHMTPNWMRGGLTKEYIPTKPTVEMVSITDTTEEGATFNGTFTVASATEPFTERGFVYRQINATKLDTIKLSGTGNSAIVTGLADYTEYEVYAYGKTAYYTAGVNSEPMTFRTLAGTYTIYPYELTALDATNIEAEKATLNAEVVAYGTKSIVSKGFIYRPNATTLKYDTAVVETAIEADKFSIEVENLTPNYTYEVYAYISTEDSTYKSAKHTFKTDKGEVIPAQVTTLPAENVGITTATWRATVVEGNEQIISREFQYWSDDVSNVKTTVPAAAIVTASGFYVNCNTLEPNTTYTFRAKVKTESGIYYGNEMTCTTKEEPKVYPVVQTFSASSVAETSATLNGRVNVEGINVTVTEKGFAYKVKGADDATLTEVTVTTTADQITRDVTGLTDKTTYVYYAFAKVAEGDTTIKGTEIEFTTLEKAIINPTITLNEVVAGVTTAKLSATVTKGNEEITKSGFRYRKVGTSAWEKEVESQLSSNGGVMTVDIDGLEELTSYEFTAFVQTASGEFTAQTPKSFSTGSGLVDVEAGMRVKTYPNPTTSDATLIVEGLTMDSKVVVSDVNGKMIMNTLLPAGQTTMTINTSELPSGVYYVTVISEGRTMTHKLIKR